MRHPLAVVFTVLMSVLLMADPAMAEGRMVYRLALSPPAEVLKAEGVATQSYANIALERLKKRFAAAGVKEAEFRVASANTVVVETGWNHQRGWMEALLTAPGLLEVRRVTPGSPDWLSFARLIPEGVELRGDNPPYLWTTKRSTLEELFKRIALPNVYVTVYPDEGGFRSVNLGDIVATQRQVRSAVAEQSSTGAPFVVLDFDPAVGASLAAAHVSDVEKVAIVLDGEVLGFVAAKIFFQQSPVRISVPRGAVADDRKQHSLWVHQVAGRLAAPLPIPIAVLKE